MNNSSPEFNSGLLKSCNKYYHIFFILIGYLICFFIYKKVSAIKNEKAIFDFDHKIDLEELKPYFKKKTFHPTIVIGAGCAGLTSGIYLAQLGYKPTVLTGSLAGGAISKTAAVSNWPGEVLVSGAEMARRLNDQALRSNVNVLAHNVVDINLQQWPFKITTKDLRSGNVQDLYTMGVIIANGVSPLSLGIEGESAFWGHGVTNCAICDAFSVRNKDAVIIGGGDTALTDAAILSPIAKKVTMLVRGTKLRAKKTLIDNLATLKNVEILYETEATRIIGNENGVSAIETLNSSGNKETIKTSGVFMAIGSIPNSKIFENKLELDSKKHIALRNLQQTSVPGVFAAGDVTNKGVSQAVAAAGDGCKAAIQLMHFLQNQEITPAFIEKEASSKVQKLVKSKAPTKEKALKQKKDNMVEKIDSIDSFNKILESAKRKKKFVVVDFYATWCGPCKRFEPTFEQLASLNAGEAIFAKVNVDDLAELASLYNVMSIPTFVFFDTNGNVVQKVVGADEIKIKNLLNQITASNQG